MMALIGKDFRNAIASFGPAMMLGIPLLLVLQFSQDADAPKISWQTAFWLTYFFSTTALYFRSFGLENRYKTFQVYSAFQVSRVRIFLSQTLVHTLTASIIGFGYLALVILFWSPHDVNPRMIELICLASVCLSPLGTVLGLILQLEREFLFSIVYLPLATPVILGAHALSQPEFSISWLYVLVSFFLVSTFIAAAVFEFFFDELSQSI
jgi:hypothetical protein